jgi:branched-chain amino acid transport system permease protein
LSTKVMWWQYVLGGVYILTILYLPSGLMGIPARLRQRRLQTGQQQEAMAVASASIETQPERMGEAP